MTMPRACLVLVLLVTHASAAHAQCALAVEARPGPTGYQPRGYGCEGLYVQLQAANLNVQIISLVKGALRLDGRDSVHLVVPNRLPGLRDSVAIYGRGREANLNWALDGAARSTRPMTWRLTVMRQIPLDASRIGLFGETRRASGLGAPVYVPVAVRPAPGQVLPETAPIELVIRIPLAGSAEWRLGATNAWRREQPVDGDGYFVLGLPAGMSGEGELEVRWSPRGRREFGAPEALRIFFW